VQTWVDIGTNADTPSPGGIVGDAEVLALFRRAMKDNDAAAMREGLDQLLGLSDGAGLSAEEEYLELDDHGLIVRGTRYYGQRSEPPEWRSQWVERLQSPLD